MSAITVCLVAVKRKNQAVAPQRPNIASRMQMMMPMVIVPRYVIAPAADMFPAFFTWNYP
jgi:hypothetical protein